MSPSSNGRVAATGVSDTWTMLGGKSVGRLFQFSDVIVTEVFFYRELRVCGAAQIRDPNRAIITDQE